MCKIELLTIRLFGEMSVSGSKSDKCQTLVVGEWSLRVKCSLDLDPYQQLSPLWVPTETSGKRWLARQVVGQQDHLVSDVASLAILSALKNLRQKNTLTSHLVDTEHSILRAFKRLDLNFGNSRKLTILWHGLISQNGLKVLRMDSVRGGLHVWAAGSRSLLVILVILVGMCGNGSGMYMEGDMVTGDNWIFMARYSTLTFCFLVHINNFLA